MTRLSRVSALIVACAFVLAAPATASAQFGGLMKKAKEKVAAKGVEQAADKAADKMGPVAPGEQLTDDILGKVLTGAQAADRMLADRDGVQAAREAKNKEFSELLDRNQPVHAAYDEANSKIRDCRSSSFSTLDDARRERFDKRAKAMQADPAAVGKMQLISAKYARRMAEAQQKQDPVLLQKVQTDIMNELTGTDVIAEVKKDSTTVDSKCGKVPTLPPSLAQEERLRKDIAAADDSIRTLEAKAITVGGQASGMDKVRYLQAKERALSIMNRMAGQGARVKYGEEEIEAVRKRLTDLEKVKRAL
jgi:hypothetical protein